MGLELPKYQNIKSKRISKKSANSIAHEQQAVKSNSNEFPIRRNKDALTLNDRDRRECC